MLREAALCRVGWVGRARPETEQFPRFIVVASHSLGTAHRDTRPWVELHMRHPGDPRCSAAASPGGFRSNIESGETECASWQTGDMLPLLRCELRHVT